MEVDEAVGNDKIPGQQFQVSDNQVRNSAGGYVFQVDSINRLKRYLVLGSESGSYHANGRELGLQNLKSLTELIKDGRGKEVIDIIREYSVEGRCAKQTTIVYCLAVCARFHDGNHSEKYVQTRREAYRILPQVCRIPTDLFQFVKFCEDVSKGIDTKTGWGRAHRKAIRNWYLEKAGRRLAFLVTKYKQRNDWSHKDLLKLCHPKVGNDKSSHAVVFKYIIKGFEETKAFVESRENYPSMDQELSTTYGLLNAVNDATAIGNNADLSFSEKEDKIINLIKNYDLVREHLPTQLLTSRKVWHALMFKMPMNALIRNLGKMSSLKMFEDIDGHNGNEIAFTICEWLQDDERLHKAKIHPFNVLLALKTYERGRGELGSNTWPVNKQIVAALNNTFYKSFKHVTPTNKRYLLGIDVSGSMAYSGCVGSSLITPREASAAMAMVALKTEEFAQPMAFSRELVPLNINKDMSLQEVVKATSQLMFGSTDCAQPMLYAMKNRIPVDVFIVYTDNDTWVGDIHPFAALQDYRRKMNLPDAKLIVCAMTSSGFTIADPNDPGMLDIVGFDSSAPQIITNFALESLG